MSDQTVTTTERELTLTRTFDAPRPLVFEAFSSCEHLKHWWGPRSWPMHECTIDFRVGGVWHYCLRGPNPEDESWGYAVYDEIVAPERIAYTDSFADAEGNVNEQMPRTRSTIDLVEVDGRTRATFCAAYPTAEDLRTVIDMGMEAGITETLDRLEEHVTGAAGSDAQA